MHVLRIYSDGGVAKMNPSPYGITWAFVVVGEDDSMLYEASGRIATADCKGYKASNNLAEMIAAVKGLEYAVEYAEKFSPASVELFSDSELTLNRLFKAYSMVKLPKNVEQRAKSVLATLGQLVSGTLVAGHPTKNDLVQGFKLKNGKRLPVSKWNVLADSLCAFQSKLLVGGDA